MRSLESVLARAERLQSYNYSLGDPGFVTEDLRRYRAVDATALQRYAREVLDRANRLVVTVDPEPRRAHHGTGEEMIRDAMKSTSIFSGRARLRGLACAAPAPKPAATPALAAVAARGGAAAWPRRATPPRPRESRRTRPLGSRRPAPVRSSRITRPTGRASS